MPDVLQEQEFKMQANNTKVVSMEQHAMHCGPVFLSNIFPPIMSPVISS